MQGDVRLLGAGLAAAVQHFRREVQPGGRRRDGASFAGEDRLVALAVGGRIGALDVGRQGHVPDALEGGVEIAVAVEADGALAEFAARRRSRLPAPRRTGCARRPAICGPAAPAPANRGRRRRRGASRKTSTLPLRYSRRLGLFLPMGSACTPARWPKRRAGKTRESLSTRQSPGLQELRQVAKHAVFPAALVAGGPPACARRRGRRAASCAISSSGRW